MDLHQVSLQLAFQPLNEERREYSVPFYLPKRFFVFVNTSAVDKGSEYTGELLASSKLRYVLVKII